MTLDQNGEKVGTSLTVGTSAYKDPATVLVSISPKRDRPVNSDGSFC